MKRNFISIKDAKKVIFKEFTLLDKDLFIKKPGRNETVFIEPIISIGKFGKNDVDAFAKKCLSKGQELLVEIDPKELVDTDFIEIEILTFQKLEDGTYYKIENNFEPNTIKLLEFDFLKKVPLKQDAYDVVVVLPSKVDSESLFISKKTSVIVVGDHFSNRRNKLNELRLGCDLYIKPFDPNIFAEYPEYLVELEEYDKDVFKMINKKHIFLNIFSEEETSYLPPETLKNYNRLIKKAQLVKLPNSCEVKYIIRQGDLDFKISDYENIIEIYNQEGIDLVPLSFSSSKTFNK
ncbi:MAG: hypothetical protein PHG03_04495 [Bacilli bacterium]|nr:hypothetical protein [Bacilli bacterium]